MQFKDATVLPSQHRTDVADHANSMHQPRARISTRLGRPSRGRFVTVMNLTGWVLMFPTRQDEFCPWEASPVIHKAQRHRTVHLTRSVISLRTRSPCPQRLSKCLATLLTTSSLVSSTSKRTPHFSRSMLPGGGVCDLDRKYYNPCPDASHLLCRLPA